MLVEIAVADAYGAGFEYTAPGEVPPNDLSAYVQHPHHHLLRPGMLTDDTQMSLANAECLLAGTTTREAFAEAYVRCFKRDVRDGYARGFQAFLESVTDGADFLARIRPDSDKSGGAMRAGPMGLLPTLDAVLEVSARQARLTHDTPMGIASAQGAALMVHHQVRGLGPIAKLPAFLAAHVPGVDWLRPNRDRTGQKGEKIVRTALAVLLDARSLSDVLRLSVVFGGDTDTVAVIAMAAASVSRELPRDLPAVLVETLEDGPYGRSYLSGIDARLAVTFDAPIVAAGPRAGA